MIQSDVFEHTAFCCACAVHALVVGLNIYPALQIHLAATVTAGVTLLSRVYDVQVANASAHIVVTYVVSHRPLTAIKYWHSKAVVFQNCKLDLHTHVPPEHVRPYTSRHSDDDEQVTGVATVLLDFLDEQAVEESAES